MKKLLFTLIMINISQLNYCSTIYSRVFPFIYNHKKQTPERQPQKKEINSPLTAPKPYVRQRQTNSLEFSQSQTSISNESYSLLETMAKYPNFNPETEEIDDFGIRRSKPIPIKRTIIDEDEQQ